MAKRPRFPSEVRERAVRLVYEQETEHKSQWAAITAIAGKIGCSAQTLSSWIKRRDVDAGRRSGITTEEQARVKALECENKELRRANEILRKAAAYFAQAELDRRGPSWWHSLTRIERRMESSRFANNSQSLRRGTMR